MLHLHKNAGVLPFNRSCGEGLSVSPFMFLEKCCSDEQKAWRLFFTFGLKCSRGLTENSNLHRWPMRRRVWGTQHPSASSNGRFSHGVTLSLTKSRISSDTYSGNINSIVARMGIIIADDNRQRLVATPSYSESPTFLWFLGDSMGLSICSFSINEG